MWLEQSKGVREKGKKDRKFSSTCGTRTHDLLLSGQAHYDMTFLEIYSLLKYVRVWVYLRVFSQQAHETWLIQGIVKTELGIHTRYVKAMSAVFSQSVCAVLKLLFIATSPLSHNWLLCPILATLRE